MMQRIMMMRREQRLLIFILVFGGGTMLLVAVLLLIAMLLINTSPREMAEASLNGVTVREFAVLPGDDAYPSTVAVDQHGIVYTGSYDTGAVWAIDARGNSVELPETRETIGAVTGLAVASDGGIYVVDRLTYNPRSAGGVIWRIEPDGRVRQFSTIQDETGFVVPHGITLDGEGNLYVSDRGRREVWRFSPNGSPSLWWTVPDDDERAGDVIPTGLAYDASTGTILITDSEIGTVYRVDRDGSHTQMIYRHEKASDQPGFDGVTVAPDGRLFLAAFGQRGAAELVEGELIYLARGFRGSSDIAYDDGRIYVNNFDQRSLILPGVSAQLPFALDVILLDGRE